MDYYSDDSFQVFLDDNHWLSQNYKAPDIVKINSDFTTNKSSNFMLREEAAKNFEDMARAFSNAFQNAQAIHSNISDASLRNIKSVD